jgi:hypothetical protein
MVGNVNSGWWMFDRWSVSLRMPKGPGEIHPKKGKKVFDQMESACDQVLTAGGVAHGSHDFLARENSEDALGFAPGLRIEGADHHHPDCRRRSTDGCFINLR